MSIFIRVFYVLLSVQFFLNMYRTKRNFIFNCSKCQMNKFNLLTRNNKTYFYRKFE